MEHKYIVEVIYEKINSENEGTGDFSLYTSLDVHHMYFSGQNKSQVKQDAQKYFDRCVRYGVYREGPGIVKSIIPPSAIKAISLLDHEELPQAEEPLSVPDVVEVTEPTPVDVVATA